ncbi:hypothetical protein [Neobacillus massiliamazoniensis]|jgi:hypothetical protein|uniref:DUF3899 domain-containing protein n=1 Tax=Neobacillus massiliamazoniensis TaxID=1499688 RepID=A0A0U1NU80_9BACI|nr:hypothetical protein [Neobacillus massiliamazoniensis]CRK81596.1 Hypothetical protein BN000_01505 [Neobacillus massiliamazoniensis]
MGKKALSIIITLAISIGLSFGLSYYMKTNFIDFSFFVGLVVTVIIWFFTSKGGFTSRFADSMIQSQTTNFKMKSQSFQFNPNIAFLTSLTYTIISFITMLIHYRSYF